MPEEVAIIDVGRLPIRSGVLEMNDPSWGGKVVRVEGIPAGDAAVTAVMRRGLVAELIFDFPHDAPRDEPGPAEEVGHVLVGSATLVAADAADFAAGWTRHGAGRVGVFQIGERMRAAIEREFGLTLRVVSETKRRRSLETVDPFPPATERAVRDLMRSTYSREYAFVRLSVQEHGSFDRALDASRSPPSIVPMGDAPEPRMVVCCTGSSDGKFPATVRKSAGVPRRASVRFA